MVRRGPVRELLASTDQPDRRVEHAERDQHTEHLAPAQAGAHQHVVKMLTPRVQRQLAPGHAPYDAAEEIRQQHQRKPETTIAPCYYLPTARAPRNPAGRS